ncbi:MerR family transcriptional regulator [Paenibacillus albidus]|uniref:MerR family transcriptional regulator n=1 Tax=Paenibacillus albidus TaxID=2041023 RepID=A0A917CPB0_9BACL|nr:MerR family transcriptional regulator [Paenibacillus albidus]GGF92718.1 MerR family transcriptional regulator [Paenibacillus albidus]
MALLIHELSKCCKTTKKAISYYEQQGLLDVKYNQSGYRVYNDNDVKKLKEITILRRLCITVAEIKDIMASEDKHQALQKVQVNKEFQLRQMKAQVAGLAVLLASHEAIEQSFDEIEQLLDDNMLIKDKLLQSFPGNYGRYLYIHFGKFLEDKIESPEQIAAFNRIMEFLDNLPALEFPEELEKYVSAVYDSLQEADVREMDEHMEAMLSDFDRYLEAQQTMLADYLEYRSSEAFRTSPAYRMQQMIMEFQKNSGYYDIFIPNLKIVSCAYSQYEEKLRTANEKLLAAYPQMSALSPGRPSTVQE